MGHLNSFWTSCHKKKKKKDKTASWDKTETREALQGLFGLTGTQLESKCDYLTDVLLRNVINAKNISTDKKAERGNNQKRGETLWKTPWATANCLWNMVKTSVFIKNTF